MTDIDFTVQFDSANFYDGVTRLDPGSTLRGRVRLEPRKNIRSRGVRMRLQWFTSGRGDRDRQIIEEVALAEGDLRAGVPLETEFSFDLPNEPWSYAGHYVNIIWELEVIVDIPLGRDIVHDERIIVAPQRIG
ncbi:MAG: hypothetical protein R3300_07445 [Candidatus Promineifilaceae bacterium]|nr:hypothetical protein [Candidatus Promineifilaceae bacterium]